MDRVVGRGSRPPKPASGRVEPLAVGEAGRLQLELRRDFVLRPAYDDRFRDALLDLAGRTVLGEQLLRRAVRDDDDRLAGTFVATVARGGNAEVLELTARPADAGLVLDHLLSEAANAGAVEVGGRVEPHLLAHLRERRFRLQIGDWVTVRSADRELADAALSGRALISRLDGEWWMRPRPTTA